MAKATISRRRLKKLADKAWLLSRGQCPEPDTSYWAGVAHALKLALGEYGPDIYLVERLEEIDNAKED